MRDETKQTIIEAIFAFGIMVPLAISVAGGKDSYFWQAVAWLIGA
jgi:hypothetical protein